MNAATLVLIRVFVLIFVLLLLQLILVETFRFLGHVLLSKDDGLHISTLVKVFVRNGLLLAMTSLTTLHIDNVFRSFAIIVELDLLIRNLFILRLFISKYFSFDG